MLGLRLCPYPWKLESFGSCFGLAHQSFTFTKLQSSGHDGAKTLKLRPHAVQMHFRPSQARGRSDQSCKKDPAPHVDAVALHAFGWIQLSNKLVNGGLYAHQPAGPVLIPRFLPMPNNDGLHQTCRCETILRKDQYLAAASAAPSASWKLTELLDRATCLSPSHLEMQNHVSRTNLTCPTAEQTAANRRW